MISRSLSTVVSVARDFLSARIVMAGRNACSTRPLATAFPLPVCCGRHYTPAPHSASHDRSRQAWRSDMAAPCRRAERMGLGAALQMVLLFGQAAWGQGDG